MAQWVKRSIFDFGSGPDLAVRGFQPCIGLCADNAGPPWDSLSPSLFAPPLLMFSLSLKKTKNK